MDAPARESRIGDARIHADGNNNARGSECDNDDLDVRRAIGGSNRFIHGFSPQSRSVVTATVERKKHTRSSRDVDLSKL
jgi:hypothetical protein